MGEQLPLLAAAGAALVAVVVIGAWALVRHSRRRGPAASDTAASVDGSRSPAASAGPETAGRPDALAAADGPPSTSVILATPLEAPGPGAASRPSEPDAAREDPPDVDAPAPGGRLAALPQGPLPGLLSREAWARAFALEERRLARYERPCAVVAIGLDGVEALSLRIGAEGAERLIEPLVATLAGRARAADLVCRIDRTRFVVLLPETDEAGARAYAARVAGATQPWLGAAPVPVRLSIGWGSPALGGTLASALVSAERRMNADRPELQGRPPGPQASSRRSAAQATGSSSGGGTVAP